MASHYYHITPLIVLIMITCFISTYTVSSRDVVFPIRGSGTNNTVNGTTMINGCWTALYDVKSCSNEIASYFNNGTIDIGASCCQAIKTITHDCWPNLLTVLGITVDESYVLRGYCDAGQSSSTMVIDPVFQVLPEPTLVDVNNETRV